MRATRRGVLRTVGVMGVGGTLLSETGRPARAQSGEAWRQFGYDDANTGHAPDNTGPTDGVGPRWTFETGGQVSSSPAVVDGTVYVGSNDRNVYALSAADGTERWRFETDGWVRGGPTVVDDTVYVGNLSGSVYALSASDGTERWVAEQTGTSHPSPTVANGTVYLGSGDGTVYALDASDGSRQWSAAPSDGDSVALIQGAPAVADGTVYVGSADDNVYALSAADGTERWRFETGADVYTAPTVADGTVYVGSNDEYVYALSAADGAERWRFETNGYALGSVAVADGTVYAGDSFGNVHALNASDGSQQWSFRDGDHIMLGPVVVDGSVYVGNKDSNVYALSAADGTERWRYETGDAIRSSPAVVNGTVYIGSWDDSVYAITETPSAKTATPSAKTATPSSTPAPTETETATPTEPLTPSPTATTAVGGRTTGGGGRGDDSGVLPVLAGMIGLGGAGAGAWWYTRGDGDGSRPGSTTAVEGVETTRIPDEVPGAPTLSVRYGALTEQAPIGAGGNADVRKAILPTSDGDVTLAIKESRASGTLHTDQVERMLDEAETWARLDDHDHVVDVVDYGAEPLPWIAMEYMDGGHLGERCGEMRLPQALWTALAVTKGVRYAHRRGVAHLDLKPENILFRTVEDAWDAPKVADWGVSKHLLDRSTGDEMLSPQYAAPEQFSEEYGPTDDATDIYQLGAVFYELFTGRPPFEGAPVRAMHQVLNESPTPPSEVDSVPEALDGILLTALAKEKDDRYDDVIYLRDALRELFEGRE
ncbi:PQQ-binding-like beta-propeller repeat protein [Haloplanus halophilus]|uniref:outer membrane protein assembly factor BamB family protein n=1 Tax=Haloplanus halophilus TaxID=2949993 RepID=UPI00203EDFF6|nr:PQQ-binding-like beta-propeller repeat protein [Haloplanus sp. GDY1]